MSHLCVDFAQYITETEAPWQDVPHIWDLHMSIWEFWEILDCVAVLCLRYAMLREEQRQCNIAKETATPSREIQELVGVIACWWELGLSQSLLFQGGS